MRKILLTAGSGLALFVLAGIRLFAAYALVAGIAAGSSDSSSVETGTIVTTTATILFAYVSELESTPDTTIADATDGCAYPCNTWIQLTEQKDVATAGLLGRLFYAKNPTVGTGHKFKATDNGGSPKPCISAAAFSGAHLTAPLDQQNGQVDIDAGLANTTGGITTGENAEVAISGLGFTANSATIAINTGEAGWAITGQADRSANSQGCALAWKNIPTIASTDPTWSYNNNLYVVTTIASFKEAGGGGGGGTPLAPRGSLLLMGIGR